MCCSSRHSSSCLCALDLDTVALQVCEENSDFSNCLVDSTLSLHLCTRKTKQSKTKSDYIKRNADEFKTNIFVGKGIDLFDHWEVIDDVFLVGY